MADLTPIPMGSQSSPFPCTPLTHTHPDDRTSFIIFLHLQRSMTSSLFSLRANMVTASDEKIYLNRFSLANRNYTFRFGTVHG